MSETSLPEEAAAAASSFEAVAVSPTSVESGLPQERSGLWVFEDEVKGLKLATGEKIRQGVDKYGEGVWVAPDRWVINISGEGAGILHPALAGPDYTYLEIGDSSGGVTKEVAGRVHAYAMRQAAQSSDSRIGRHQAALEVQKYILARQWEKEAGAVQ